MDAETRGAIDALFALNISALALSFALAGRLAEHGVLTPADCTDMEQLLTVHFDAAASNAEGRAILDRMRAQFEAQFSPELARFREVARRQREA
jgi:hypothetical protein